MSFNISIIISMSCVGVGGVVFVVAVCCGVGGVSVVVGCRVGVCVAVVACCVCLACVVGCVCAGVIFLSRFISEMPLGSPVGTSFESPPGLSVNVVGPPLYRG